MNTQKNNPLHGVTLEQIINSLVDYYGWEKLGDKISIKCFKFDPSVKSSLKFLRKTPWARAKVESLYVFVQNKKLHKKLKQQQRHQNKVSTKPVDERKKE